MIHSLCGAHIYSSTQYVLKSIFLRAQNCYIKQPPVSCLQLLNLKYAGAFQNSNLNQVHLEVAMATLLDPNCNFFCVYIEGTEHGE